jgi:hypothetical protein
MFIYLLRKELSSPNVGRTYKITPLCTPARQNLTRTFNCTYPAGVRDIEVDTCAGSFFCV